MALQVTKHLDLNLPKGTKSRMEADNHALQSHKPHDIRSMIPMVDYTNPAKFPPYAYREFPKMPLLDGNKPIVIDETGTVLVFHSEEEEIEFKGMNPELADELDRNAPAKQLSEKYAELSNEVSELKRRLREAGIEPEPKRQTALADLVNDDSAPSPDDDGDGLRSQLKQAEKTSAPHKPNPLRK